MPDCIFCDDKGPPPQNCLHCGRYREPEVPSELVEWALTKDEYIRIAVLEATAHFGSGTNFTKVQIRHLISDFETYIRTGEF